MVGCVVGIRRAVLATIEVAAIVNWVIGSGESVAWIVIDCSTVAVVGVVQICNSIVVIVPINIIFKAVPVNI